MNLTTEKLKKLIKEVLQEYSPDDAMHDMAYGTDSRKKPAKPAAKAQPEQIKAKANKLMQAAMEGDPDAIAMLMAYGE